MLVKELNMGYDGVIIKGIQEGNTGLMVDDYIVFEPEQIQIVRRNIIKEENISRKDMLPTNNAGPMNDIPLRNNEREKIEAKKQNHFRLIMSLVDYFDKQNDPYMAIYKYINTIDRPAEPSIRHALQIISLQDIKIVWDSNDYKLLCELAAMVHYLGKRYFNGKEDFFVTNNDVDMFAQRVKNIAKQHGNKVNEAIRLFSTLPTCI